MQKAADFVRAFMLGFDVDVSFPEAILVFRTPFLSFLPSMLNRTPLPS